MLKGKGEGSIGFDLTYLSCGESNIKFFMHLCTVYKPRRRLLQVLAADYELRASELLLSLGTAPYASGFFIPTVLSRLHSLQDERSGHGGTRVVRRRDTR